MTYRSLDKRAQMIFRAKARVRLGTFEGVYTKGRARYERDCVSRGERPAYHNLSADMRLFWELEADQDPKARRVKWLPMST